MALENLGLPYVPTLLEALILTMALESVPSRPPSRGGDEGRDGQLVRDEMGRDGTNGRATL
jgi:hypothetical protein